MLRYRTQELLAVGLGILISGCLSEPEFKTNLRPEGPPEVLAVLAVNAVTRSETAAFCRYVGGALDEKGPGFVRGVTVCPDFEEEFSASELFPLGWRIRVVFDELLEPDAVEELDCDADRDGVQDDPIVTCEGHIANTQPVTLTCGGASFQMTYDGYYYPNGNKESVPLGPAIVVEPDADALLAVATGTMCNVAINEIVVDKGGEQVASGPELDSFDVKVADLAIIGTDPSNPDEGLEPAVIAPTDPIAFSFNANLDESSITAADFEILDENGDPVPGVEFALVEDLGSTDVLTLSHPTGLAAGSYTARLKANAEFTEVNGGDLTLAADEDVRFIVDDE